MRHFFPIVAFVGFTCLAVTPPAAADPISITSGSIVAADPFGIGSNSIAIAGTRGFSIEGVVDLSEGFVAPLSGCGTIGCLAGTTISLGTFLADSAVVGTATLDGNQYHIGFGNDPASVLLQFVGTATLPQPVSSPTVVTAPFSATQSLFSFEIFDGVFTSVPLNGSGVASLSLSPSLNPDFPPLWVVDQVRYDFNDVPAVVPEPSTMTLITLGLAVTTLRARMRRTRDKA
jgi:PEP-CTERM motif